MWGMWYKSPKWMDGLISFGEWYELTCNFVHAEGDYDVDSRCFHQLHENSKWVRIQRSPALSRPFGLVTNEVIDFCCDVINLDPSVVWDIYCHIDCYMQLRKQPGEKPRYPVLRLLELPKTAGKVLRQR